MLITRNGEIYKPQVTLYNTLFIPICKWSIPCHHLSESAGSTSPRKTQNTLAQTSDAFETQPVFLIRQAAFNLPICRLIYRIPFYTPSPFYGSYKANSRSMIAKFGLKEGRMIWSILISPISSFIIAAVKACGLFWWNMLCIVLEVFSILPGRTGALLTIRPTQNTLRFVRGTSKN